MSDRSEPRVFIGASSESKAITDALEEALRGYAHIDRSDLDVFRPGHFTLEELAREAGEVDFAVFVLGRDDSTESRNNVVPSPRDNVVFEAGLLTGELGRERVFYVIDRSGTKIPTDWGGLGYLTFDSSKERPRDKIYDAASAIVRQIAKRKPLPPEGVACVAGYWWQFVESDDTGAVLSILDIVAAGSPAACVQGRSWSTDGHLVAQYRTRAAEFNEKNHTLYYYWKGEHPHDDAALSFFGVGEIRFDPDVKEPLKATGWYSHSNRSDLTLTRIRSTRYSRATPEEIAAIESDCRDRRAALVSSKLQKRHEMDI